MKYFFDLCIPLSNPRVGLIIKGWVDNLPFPFPFIFTVQLH